MNIKYSFLACIAMTITAHAEEPLDYDMIGKIMDEGLNRSHVMETVYHLTDVIGPRLTNSPGMREAAEWSKSQFEAWGLENTEFEYFYFGRGWTYEEVTVHMTAPRQRQLRALPFSWHPSTDGVIEAETVLASIESEDDFEKYEGKLEGKIVLLGKESDQKELTEPVFRRLSDEDLAELEEFPIPDAAIAGESSWTKAANLRQKIGAFVAEQGAIAIVRPSGRTSGLNAQSYAHGVDNTPALPAVAIAVEDFDRLVRLSARDEAVRMSIEVKAQFYDDNLKAQNVLAEIPGRGSRPGIVIAGAHLDSWFMADGGVDNAAGSAVVMEAARILAKLGVRPKRTIRFALWDGEEQGLYGSTFHVLKHFATRAGGAALDELPKYSGLEQKFPVQKGRDFERLSAYFNLDNGSGRIRGIWGEGNPSLQPIFERWFEPFHEFGAETVVLRPTRGTDHQPFLLMGLPGFQFIQDPLDYFPRLHHTDIDTASHVHEKDLQQAAIILASILWHTANRDERLPRLPIPTEPIYAN